MSYKPWSKITVCLSSHERPAPILLSLPNSSHFITLTMDSPPIDVEEERTESAQRKGKWRAAAEESDETTPLLAPSAQLIRDDGPPPLAESSERRRLLVLLLTIFLSTLCACILLLLVLVAIAWWSYSSKISGVRDEVLNRAVVFRGPDRVDVLNATEGSVWLQVDSRVGIDAGEALDTILGVEDKDNIGMVTLFRRSMGRWAIGRMKEVTVRLDGVSMLFGKDTLVNVTTPAISLPLTLDIPYDEPWLTALSLPIHVHVTQDAEALEEFAKASWRIGVVQLAALSSRITVLGGGQGEASWRRLMNVTQEDVIIPLKFTSMCILSIRKHLLTLFQYLIYLVCRILEKMPPFLKYQTW